MIIEFDEYSYFMIMDDNLQYDWFLVYLVLSRQARAACVICFIHK